MKINRQQVLDKYDGHCAYCGCEITLKTMQVDHLKPKRNGGVDDPKNLMPACRLCNHYKRAYSLESFRYNIKEMYRKLQMVYIFRVAEKYGMLTWDDWDGKFYFERVK